ncbi:MAG TPA: LamG domain-containing protein [Kofleriaceae bacterium]|nr:LamG domain-containing protein [Kofleriaceae bacterium]
MSPLATVLWIGLGAGGCGGLAAGDGEADRGLGETADAITAANFSFDAVQFTGNQVAQTATAIPTPVDAFTLEFWVRYDGLAGAQAMVYNGDSSTSGYGLYVGTSGTVSALLGGVGWVGCTSCQLARGQWTHLAVERVGPVWMFFQNGALRGQSVQPSLAPRPPVGKLSIGASPSGGEAFTGAIDEVRIWSFPVPQQMLMLEMSRALRGNENGLAAYYRLDEGSGAASVDASPGNHPLSLVGPPTWISSGATLSTGIALDDAEFSGAAAGTTSTVVTTRTDGITLESWVRWDGGPNVQEVMYNGMPASNGYGLYLSNGNVLLLSGVALVTCTSCALATGDWHHLAAVLSQSQWTVYEDGEPQTVWNGLVPTASPSGVFTIGAGPPGAGAFGAAPLIGAVDEIRVWGVPRTAQQIQASYNMSLAGDEPDLLAYYRFDEGSGTVADDTAGNHPISLTRTTWATSGALLKTAAF